MQGKKLYVGNLDYSVTSEELSDLFSAYGEVTHVKIIKNKGFGFVEMSNNDEAESALKGLNSKEYKNRKLKIDEARENKDRKRKFFKKEEKNGHRKIHKNNY